MEASIITVLLCTNYTIKCKELSLKDKFWNCPSCKTKDIPRDWNASVNLLREGASSLGLGDVREVQLPVAV